MRSRVIRLCLQEVAGPIQQQGSAEYERPLITLSSQPILFFCFAFAREVGQLSRSRLPILRNPYGMLQCLRSPRVGICEAIRHPTNAPCCCVVRQLPHQTSLH